MNSDATTPSRALMVARRLLGRANNGNGPEVTADALRLACVQVCDALRESLGEEGNNALLSRALAHTERAHPALAFVRGADHRVNINGVVESVDAHGVVVVTAAIEAFLAALVEILDRLIGEDMTTRVLDHGALGTRGTSDPRKT